MVEPGLNLSNHADLLPPLVLDFQRLLGWQVTIEIIRARGGTMTHIPERFSEKCRYNELYDLIGEGGMKALVNEMAGENLYLPKCVKAVLAVRDQLIVQERNAGASWKSLALKYRISERRIADILSTQAQIVVHRSAQADLFEL